MPANEIAWFKTFAHWGTRTTGGLRCGYYNSSVGCQNANCGFVNVCLVCGQAHPAVGNHNIGDPQTG